MVNPNKTSSLGKVLLNSLKSSGAKVSLFNMDIPLEELVKRDCLPLIMAVAARKDFIDMSFLLKEEFTNIEEPNDQVLLSGFVLTSDPDPAIWAIPLRSAITTLPGSPIFKLDEAVGDWNEAVAGTFGEMNLVFTPAPE